MRVWLKWRAPQNGLVTFCTRGSAFDTLLAVYTGTSVAALTDVAKDDDGGGFFSSRAVFRAAQSTVYDIAVDGRAGAVGDIVLGWVQETEVIQFIPPRILGQPQSQTVRPGDSATFIATVDPGNDPTQVRFQWHHNFLPIAGATNSSYTVTNVLNSAVGVYGLTITTLGHAGTGSLVESALASLEIGNQVRPPTSDKFEDLIGAGSPGFAPDGSGGGFNSVTPGIINNQTLLNLSSTTQPCEGSGSGQISGASRWFTLTPQSGGALIIDTVGSEIPTALAVYTGTNLCDLGTLQFVARDQSNAVDGVHSQVRFTTQPAVNYRVAVSGVGGAEGLIKLNWYLGAPPSAAVAFTTDGLFLYTDRARTNQTRGVYRARLK